MVITSQQSSSQVKGSPIDILRRRVTDLLADSGLRLMRDPEGNEFCVEPGPVGR
jgi:hypothetical protein